VVVLREGLPLDTDAISSDVLGEVRDR
jgi:hypothetical protein